MRISLVSCFFFSLYIAAFFSMAALSVSGQCQRDQQLLLLGFKNSLNSSLSEKLVKWNQGTDCCSWDGITCDASGRVIGLDLSSNPFREKSTTQIVFSVSNIFSNLIWLITVSYPSFLQGLEI
ncbi:hypothetical protein GQ457_06G005780 [Hibiscus cannabinus]